MIPSTIAVGTLTAADLDEINSDDTARRIARWVLEWRRAGAIGWVGYPVAKQVAELAESAVDSAEQRRLSSQASTIHGPYDEPIDRAAWHRSLEAIRAHEEAASQRYFPRLRALLVRLRDRGGL